MGNNGNCESCAMNNARSQMDMRRQRAAMYDSRYTNSHMMPRNMTCNDNNMQDSCMNTRERRDMDDCGHSMHDEIYGMPLTMGYVPWQKFGCTYEAMEGLHAGTIFPDLDKPFLGRRGMR